MQPQLIVFDIELPTGRQPATWRSENSTQAPTRIRGIDDRVTANSALGMAREGMSLLYTGDFHNARQLATAMMKRLDRTRQPPKSALEAFSAERLLREREQDTAGKILVVLDEKYQLSLKRAPDVREACLAVWGEPTTPWTVVPLRTLLGMMGAAEWRKRGLAVPGLNGKIAPHYGVFSPTRNEYVGLLQNIPSPKGKTVFDIGTGTGVLSLVLLHRGAASVVGTDADPRCVACAKDNAERLGFTKKMQVIEQDLFPSGVADLVVCNPPWIPVEPKSRIDNAVFDPNQRFLKTFLAGLKDHLAPDGSAYLIYSNFSELIGLTPKAFLLGEFASAGLTLGEIYSTPPMHPKASDRNDPLYAVRSREVTSMYTLMRQSQVTEK